MTIVVAFSPDQPGRAALQHGITLATERTERLVVVNATRGDAYVDTRFAHDDEIGRVRAELEALEVETALLHDVVVDVADEVVRVAEQEHASLVVVGVRRRSRVGKLLLGSVAQQVILEADCPVLAVKD